MKSLLNLIFSGVLTGWESKKSFARINNGFSYENGYLTIPRSGFYYVYSQVYFQHDEHGVPPHLEHRVFLIQKKYDGIIERRWIILSAYGTKADHVQGNQGFYTSNTNGLFRLQKGDRLAVGVNPVLKGFISFSEAASYFGAFMV